MTEDVYCPEPTLKLHCLDKRKRVFVDDNEEKLYKFDTRECEEPVFGLLKSVLPEAEVRSFGSYKCLMYNYRTAECPAHNATHTQVRALLHQLHDVHEKGFVHSDIRRSNILIGNDSQSAWIIDFELAAFEDTPYPSGYNHNIGGERHRDAQRGKQRKKSHDVFSLDKIFPNFSIYESYLGHS